jgi:hypothetical protein
LGVRVDWQVNRHLLYLASSFFCIALPTSRTTFARSTGTAGAAAHCHAIQIATATTAMLPANATLPQEKYHRRASLPRCERCESTSALYFDESAYRQGRTLAKSSTTESSTTPWTRATRSSTAGARASMITVRINVKMTSTSLRAKGEAGMCLCRLACYPSNPPRQRLRVLDWHS